MNTTTAANSNVEPGRAGYWTAFRQMPLVLQAYAGFLCVAIPAWAIGFAILFWPAVNQYVTPYGNATTLSPYLFTIYYVFAAPQHQYARWLVLMLPVFIAIWLVLGISEMSRMLSDPNVAIAAVTTNSYMQYPPSRVILNIVLPLFWILMLLSPEVWRWTVAGSARVGTDATGTGSYRRFSLLDLFYLVSVCAVCTAVAIGLMHHVRERLDEGKAAAANQTAVPISSPRFNSLPKPAHP